MKNLEKTNATINTAKNVVTISMPGRQPIPVSYQEGDTVQSVLSRGNVTIDAGDTCAIGNKRVENFETTSITAGDTIVVASKVANG